MANYAVKEEASEKILVSSSKCYIRDVHHQKYGVGEHVCLRLNIFVIILGDELETFDSDGDPTYIYCLKFCPKQLSHNLLAMGSEDGIVSVLDTSLSSSVKNEFHAHRNAIFDIAWMPETDDKVNLNPLFKI